MENSFSQRMGMKPVKTDIQLTSMNDDLRNALWNDLIILVWDFVNDRLLEVLQIKIWRYYFKRLIDDAPRQDGELQEWIKTRYFKMEWYEVYDFIEFIANNYPYPGILEQYTTACNETLKRELSAYHFIGTSLVQITSDQEIAEIEEALDVTKQYTPHLGKALKLLADRTSPDYTNSIKESISAVEAICKLVTRSSKVTLGDALGQLESKLGTLHPALRNAFNSLYGYTSDAEGIRHGMLGESELDVEDAKFMLIACSAFINYLVAKADKAGIELSPKNE